MVLLSVSDIARRIGRELGERVSPAYLSNLYYTGKLDDSRCQMIGRSRAIPEDEFPSILEEVRSRFEQRHAREAVSCK